MAKKYFEEDGLQIGLSKQINETLFGLFNFG
jgi:hypothetical protein